jgi:hypothetical protein
MMLSGRPRWKAVRYDLAIEARFVDDVQFTTPFIPLGVVELELQ